MSNSSISNIYIYFRAFWRNCLRIYLDGELVSRLVVVSVASVVLKANSDIKIRKKHYNLFISICNDSNSSFVDGNVS